MEMVMGKLLTTAEAAEILGVTPFAVVNAIKRGSLPGVKRGRDWFIDEDDVQKRAKQRAEGKYYKKPRN